MKLHRHLRSALLCGAALTSFVLHGDTVLQPPSVHPIRCESVPGEFGGDLALLKTFYTAAGTGDGNHYFEMWKPDAGIRGITRACGLTNNRALFVNSHGDAVPTVRGTRYGFRPHQSRLPEANHVPSFSARDLASVVGPAAATNIHNICISGCNIDGMLNPVELRHYFPSATNITHIAAGESGFEPMFIQALTLPSGDIRPLFETAQKKRSGEMAYSLGHSDAPNAMRLPPYIAELFLPGASQPYATRIAGRDLLDYSTPRLSKTPE